MKLSKMEIDVSDNVSTLNANETDNDNVNTKKENRLKVMYKKNNYSMTAKNGPRSV